MNDRESLLSPRRVKVAGRCPCGCGETLYVGEGGHITCGWAGCPDPGYLAEIVGTPYLLQEFRRLHITVRGATVAALEKAGEPS